MVSVKHEPFHLLLEDLTVKWKWGESELVKFREMWNAGDHVKTIAKELGTNKRSIILTVYEQAELGEIVPRSSGLDGN